MKSKVDAIFHVIFPNKRINYIVFFLYFIGFISGCFFLFFIDNDSKILVSDKIINYVLSINNGTYDSLSTFLNCFLSNGILCLFIWIIGLSIVGNLLNSFIIYVKGLILGFSLSGIVYTYKIKGIIFSILYVFPNEILSMISILILGIYSVNLSISIIKEMLKRNHVNNFRVIYKRYLFILFVSIFLFLLSSLYEAFVMPKLLNVFY